MFNSNLTKLWQAPLCTVQLCHHQSRWLRWDQLSVQSWRQVPHIIQGRHSSAVMTESIHKLNIQPQRDPSCETMRFYCEAMDLEPRGQKNKCKDFLKISNGANLKEKCASAYVHSLTLDFSFIVLWYGNLQHVMKPITGHSLLYTPQNVSSYCSIYITRCKLAYQKTMKEKSRLELLG